MVLLIFEDQITCHLLRDISRPSILKLPLDQSLLCHPVLVSRTFINLFVYLFVFIVVFISFSL